MSKLLAAEALLEAYSSLIPVTVEQLAEAVLYNALFSTMDVKSFTALVYLNFDRYEKLLSYEGTDLESTDRLTYLNAMLAEASAYKHTDGEASELLAQYIEVIKNLIGAITV